MHSSFYWHWVIVGSLLSYTKEEGGYISAYITEQCVPSDIRYEPCTFGANTRETM